MYRAHFWRHAVLFLTLTAGLPLLCLACGGTKSAVRDADVPVPDTESVLDDSGSAKEQLPKSPDARGLPSKDTDIQLLESVIRQNTAARESIHSLYVDFSWQEDCVAPEVTHPLGTIPGGRQTVEGTTKVWQKNGKYHQDYTRRRTWLDDSVTQDERFIWIMSDTYFVEYHDVPNTVLVYHFDNRNSLYGPAQNKTSPPLNMLDFGFRLVHGDIQEHYETSVSRHPGYFRWSIEPQHVVGERYFRITKTADIAGNPYLAQDVVVAAERGFLVTEYNGYERDGTIVRSMTCDLHEIQEGVWFPMKVKRYQSEWESTLQIEVKDVQVNCEIDDRTFTMDRMAFESIGVRMIEYTPGGRDKEVKTFWNDQWVPIDMVPKDSIPSHGNRVNR